MRRRSVAPLKQAEYSFYSNDDTPSGRKCVEERQRWLFSSASAAGRHGEVDCVGACACMRACVRHLGPWEETQ